MKYLLPFLFLVSASYTHAASWKVFGACSEEPVHQGQKDAKSLSVGDYSVQVFEENKIPYVGSELGFNSIIGTPTDRRSIEIVSSDELRAYGWCYSVDGKIPDQMPNEVQLSNNAELVWFYAYSTVINNQWQEDYCTPAYKIKAKQFCGTASAESPARGQ